MTDQPTAASSASAPIPGPPAAHHAYRPEDPAASALQALRPFVSELSSMAGGAPNLGTVFRLIRVLFHAARLLRRSRGDQPS